MGDLVVGRDEHSVPTWVINFPDLPPENVVTTLAPGVEQAIAVPTGVSVALFTYNVGANVWVGYADAPIAPWPFPGNFVPINAELNPVGRFVDGLTDIRFICDTVAFVNVTMYQR